MKLFCRFAFTVMLSFGAFGLISAQSSDKASEKFLGSIEGGYYKNQYFGFQLPAPADMLLLDATQRAAFAAAGAEMLAKDVAGNKAAWEKAATSEVLLLSMADREPGPGTASLNIGAVRQPADVTPRMVCEDAKDFFVQNPKMKMLGETTQVTLARRKFCRMELNFKADEALSVDLRYYATIVKGHSLTFVITYSEKSQLEKFEKVLTSLKFFPA